MIHMLHIYDCKLRSQEVIHEKTGSFYATI